MKRVNRKAAELVTCAGCDQRVAKSTAERVDDKFYGPDCYRALLARMRAGG